MKFFIFSIVTFFCTLSFAENFICNSVEKNEIQESQKFEISGCLDADEMLDNISVIVFENNSQVGNKLITSYAQFAIDSSFRPRTRELEKYHKYTLEHELGDTFLLFLPSKIKSQKFKAYFKVSYNGTYPDLEKLQCEFR